VLSRGVIIVIKIGLIKVKAHHKQITENIFLGMKERTVQLSISFFRGLSFLSVSTENSSHLTILKHSFSFCNQFIKTCF